MKKKEILIILFMIFLVGAISFLGGFYLATKVKLFQPPQRAGKCVGKADGTICTIQGDPIQSGYCYQGQCSPLRDFYCHEEKLPSSDAPTRYDFLEFCLPKNESFLKMVEGIKGTIEFSCTPVPRGRTGGRIGCGENEYLCTLASRTPHQVLCELSKLIFIKKIQGSYAE